MNILPFMKLLFFFVWFVSLVIIVLFRTGEFAQTLTDHGILSQIKKNKHHSDCFWELACRSLYFRTLRQDYFICEVALVGTLFINTHTHAHTICQKARALETIMALENMIYLSKN